MGLIDREAAAKELQIIANKFLAIGKRKAAEDYSFVLTCLDELADAYPVDLVHAAGGCYCRECHYSDIVTTQCGAKYFECQHFDSYVEADDFCSYGRRREDAE